MLTLASASEARAAMLRAAGVEVAIRPARLDEDVVRAALAAVDAPARDVADTLAEMKATKGARPGLVLGADQVLAHGRAILGKPATPDEAVRQLHALRGGQHRLLSAAVIAEDGRPVWRHVGEVRMVMRDLSDAYVEAYVERNWESIRHSVGAYKLEEEGARLFHKVDGDYFTVLGLPLLAVLDHLAERGLIET
ncbi:nucleoside triphosphate pyrophosphatase [Jannaschia sp. W003]|uniref:Maf family protein n=1 Tax=Jannaschia sp. W003 TaxID=2867012 RepID=UPI0021A350AE|nr:nucleoside triphosphate pyrophosphatase [Jannaschia sp. W003]UWQ21988.1 Maf family protein [Jannaschia sp. W003]